MKISYKNLKLISTTDIFTIHKFLEGIVNMFRIVDLFFQTQRKKIRTELEAIVIIVYSNRYYILSNSKYIIYIYIYYIFYVSILFSIIFLYIYKHYSIYHHVTISTRSYFFKHISNPSRSNSSSIVFILFFFSSSL